MRALPERVARQGPLPWLALALAVATVAVYADVRRHAFVTYDDRAYLFENPFVPRGLTPAGVVWAFRTFYVSNWHPLTWLSHMLDFELFGPDPGAHHLVSVLWHVANALLLLRVLARMTGSVWRSALVAALFALHPLHVESVAWVAERKDLLSTAFGLLCLGLYDGWTRHPARGRYSLMLACYALSLASKPMLVTLPFLMLLLDVWPLGRTASTPRARRLVEKLPLFALSLASSVVTWVSQRQGGSMQGVEALGVAARFANAVVAYVDYLLALAWPVALAVLYPIPERLPVGRLLASATLLLGISALVLRHARSRPWLAVGWLWYLGTLVPVIGIVQVGLQARADRYTYFPAIGIFAMLAWSLPSLRTLRAPRAAALGAALAAALLALAWRAQVQVGYWRNTLTLFDRTLAVTRDNAMAHAVKGYALATERRWFDDAVAEYREALRIQPDLHLAMSHLADALLEKRELDEAVAWYQRLLELDPARVHERHNLAVALGLLRRPNEAIPHFEAVVRARPRLVQARVGLGIALVEAGRVGEGIATFEGALGLAPEDAELRLHLGAALASQGRHDEARVQLREALRLRPGLERARAALERLEGGAAAAPPS
jgi:tetratricopeptide (TPR) repeat protein